MKWVDFVDKIYLINLSHRIDRLIKAVEQFDNYGIYDFDRIDAVYNKSNGAIGLRDTILLIFNEALEKGYENILVFEDDFEFVKEKIWVDEVMNNVVKELPENYHILWLGGQPTGGFEAYYSAHLLPIQKYYATQCCAYSKQGIKEIMSRGLQYPIDNFFVDHIQPLRNCYCVHPMLVSQRPDFSDIGRAQIDWRPFMDIRHEQKIAELNDKLNANRR